MPTHNNPTTDTQWLFAPPGQPVPPPEREIVYNRTNRDYDMRLAGEYVGSRESYHAAEVALDNLVYAALTHTPDPDTNHRCDCGAALNEFGLCEACTDRAEGEAASDENERHDERTAEYEPKPRPRGAFEALRVDEPALSCPSCDAPTHAPGTCPACRVEATALLHSDELTFSQYVALAVAGAG